MSNTDSFIEEVSEEVRKDKLYTVYKKYGWIVGLLLFAIIGGAAYSEWSKAKSRSIAQSQGDAILAALGKDNATDQAAALAALTPEGDAAILVAFQHAAVLADGGEKAAALEVLNGLTERSDLPVAYRDLAALKSVILAGKDMDNAKRMLALDALSQAGAPFRPIALEQKAMAHVDAGEKGAAVKILLALLQEPQVSNSLRQRSQQMIVALGGELPAFNAGLSSEEASQ